MDNINNLVKNLSGRGGRYVLIRIFEIFSYNF